MAISTYVGNEIVANTDTFAVWLARMNDVIGDMGSSVVTSGNNNEFDVTIGSNFTVANTLFVTGELSGGEDGSPAALKVSSNAFFNGSDVLIGSNTSLTLNGDIVIDGPTKTFSVVNDEFTINSTAFDVNSTTTFNGDVTFSANATFDTLNVTTLLTANTITPDFIVIAGNTVLDSSRNATFAEISLDANHPTLQNFGLLDAEDAGGYDSLLLVPTGNNAARPSTPDGAGIRYNTDAGAFEGYNQTSWVPVGGGGQFKGDNGTVGTAPGDIFRIHEMELNANVTIANTENAVAAGPLTVANNVTLTVEGNLVIV